MISTRQTDIEQEKDTVKGEAATLPDSNVPVHTQISTTASIQSLLMSQSQDTSTIHSPGILKVPSTGTLKHKESYQPAMFGSFLILSYETPPATLNEKVLLHTQNISDNMKSELGVKRSFHKVELLTCNDHDCSIIFSPVDDPRKLNLNQLPGKANACYIFTPDKKMYYADKQLKLCTEVTMSEQVYEILCQSMGLKFPHQNECNHYVCMVETLSNEQLAIITNATRHMHSLAYYKENPDATPSSSTSAVIEAVNSIACQLLSPRHFPTCYAVCNEEGKYMGVASKSLPGFKPNRDKHLLPEDLKISSLKNMVKIRDEEHDVPILKSILKEKLISLITLLKRPVDGNSSYLSQGWSFLSNGINYYFGYPTCAVQIIEKFAKISEENIYSVKFGVLDELRQLLLDRKSAICKSKESYFATQHKHPEEILIIDELIEQLNLILLDEIAIYMKHLHRISNKLREEWVDIDAEIAKNKEACIQIDEGPETGLKTKLDVKLEDIRNYRNTCGLAIGLTTRYFTEDPDGHSKNLSSNGCNVDGDRAFEPLTYRFRKLAKPGANYFTLDEDDFIEFPNLKKAKFRYWPTVVSRADTSIDAALSIICDATINYFDDQDSQNYQSLETSPVFNFQKYVQLIILSLTNKDMYTACAKLHMPNNIQMLNENYEPVPLINEQGEPDDLRTNWIKHCSDRALEGRNLAKRLPALKAMLNRHDDLILEMVQDHFAMFIKDREMELSGEAFKNLNVAIPCDDALKLIKDSVSPETIKTAFFKLKEEILSTKIENTKRVRMEMPQFQASAQEKVVTSKTL